MASIRTYVILLQSGVMMIWHSDARGRLVAEPVQHHLQEPINQMVLQPPNFQVPSMYVFY